MDFRSAALGQSKFKEKKATISISGLDYSVIIKEISVKTKDYILSKAQAPVEFANKKAGELELMGGRLVAATVLYTTFKDDGTPWFNEDDGDFDMLLNLPSETPFLNEIFDISTELNKVDKKAIKKPLAEIQK